MTDTDRLDRIERKVDDLLRMVARLAQNDTTGRTDVPQAIHDPERGMFLPGTGWVQDA